MIDKSNSYIIVSECSDNSDEQDNECIGLPYTSGKFPIYPVFDEELENNLFKFYSSPALLAIMEISMSFNSPHPVASMTKDILWYHRYGVVKMMDKNDEYSAERWGSNPNEFLSCLQVRLIMAGPYNIKFLENKVKCDWDSEPCEIKSADGKKTHILRSRTNFKLGDSNNPNDDDFL
jgi:hypothetical protein